jgi:hypothetical protein
MTNVGKSELFLSDVIINENPVKNLENPFKDTLVSKIKDIVQGVLVRQLNKKCK